MALNISVEAGFGDDEIAVDGVALGDHVEAAPETRARSGIAAWSDPNQQRNRGQRGRSGEQRNLRALHAKRQRRSDGEIEQAHDGRDLKGIEKTDEDNAGQDSAERGAGGFDEIGRARGGACGKVAFLRDQARRGDKQRTRSRAEDAQADQRGEQHGNRTDQLAGNDLEKGLGAAQRPEGCGKARGQRDFERGDEPTRAAAVRAWRARDERCNRAAEGGPQEPGRQQNAERDLVAVEDLNELAHEHDLAHDGGKAAEGKRGARGGLGCGVHWKELKDQRERNARLTSTADSEQ